MRRKGRCLILALTVGLSAFFSGGCAPKTAQISAETFQYGPGVITQYWDDSEYEMNMSTDIAQELSKRTGIQIVYLRPSPDNGLSLESMMAANAYPDIITCQKSNRAVQSLIDAGAVCDIHELMQTYAPEMLEQMPQGYATYYAAEDGKNYYWTDRLWTPEALDNQDLDVVQDDFVATCVRSDIYQAIGQPQPADLQEYTQMLRQIHEKYPDLPGLYLAGFSSENGLFAAGNSPAYGFFAEWGLRRYDVEDEMISSVVRSPAFVEMITWMNQLYTEGLLSAESFIDEEEAYQSKISQGQVAGFHGPIGGYALLEGVSYTAIPYFSSMDGAFVRANSQERATMVSQSSPNKEQVMRWISYLYTQQGQELAGWGIEGKHWQKVQGVPQKTQAWDELDDIRQCISQWGFFQNDAFVDRYHADALFMKIEGQRATWNTMFRQEVTVDLFDSMRGSAIQEEELRVKKARLDELAYVGYPKMIMAGSTQALQEAYDSFLQDCEKNGLQEVEDCWTQAYQKTVQ